MITISRKTIAEEFSNILGEAKRGMSPAVLAAQRSHEKQIERISKSQEKKGSEPDSVHPSKVDPKTGERTWSF